MTILNPEPAPPTHVPASRIRVWDLILEDLDTALQCDPVARTRFEVVVSYPGVHALWAHRATSAMRCKGMRIPAQLLQQLTRTVTGVDIHPAACIGCRLSIDRTTGVVIGETAVAGEDCLILHGVTLGRQRMVHGKRHPTVGNRVTVGTGAKVLDAMHIDDGAEAGTNTVVVEGMPSGGIAIGMLAKLRKLKCQVSEDMNGMNIDPSLFI